MTGSIQSSANCFANRVTKAQKAAKHTQKISGVKMHLNLSHTIKKYRYQPA